MAAIVVIYIVLGVLYESLVHPLTVLSTLPSAGVGAVLALMLFGMEFSLIALIGVFLLIGIVKKNAIMIIDFALEAERSRGSRRTTRCARPACLRFRPIMMTTLAAALGALPLAIGFGEGSELRQPLGIAIIGGLIASQLLTLLTTPGGLPAAGQAPPAQPRRKDAQLATLPNRSRRRGPTASAPRRLGGHRELTMTALPFAHAARATLALAALSALGACTSLAPNDKFDAPTSASFLEPPPGWMAAAPADTLDARPVVDAVQRSGAQPAGAAGRGVEPERGRRCGRRRAIVGRGARAAGGVLPHRPLDAGVTRSGVGGSAIGVATTSGGTRWSPRARLAIAPRAIRPAWARAGRPTCGAAWPNRSSAAKSTAPRPARPTSRTRRCRRRASFVTDYLSAARGRRRDRDPADHHRRLRALADDHAEPLRRGDRGQERRAAGADHAGQRAPSLAALVQQRKQLFHAMAVLAGQAPANFALPQGDWNSTSVPAIPPSVPSELLQRRPDIAAAERRVAAANAQIGVARAAYFPSLTLSGNGGSASASLGDLFNASSFAWSLGASLAETIFDGGARTARVDEARAGWKEAVANYRQTVLTAFQGVEDQLSAPARSLEQQRQLRECLGRRRPDRADHAEPVQAGAGRLHRRRHRGSIRAHGASFADADLAQSPDRGASDDRRTRWWLVDAAARDEMSDRRPSAPPLRAV